MQRSVLLSARRDALEVQHMPPSFTPGLQPSADAEIGTDSGLVAFADSRNVDGIATAFGAILDGSETLPDARIACTERAVVCDVGSDGIIALSMQVDGCRTTAVRLNLEPYEAGEGQWFPIALIPCVSGDLVVGDPSMLQQFEPEPFAAPYEAFGGWAVFTTPGPGWLAVHALKRAGGDDEPNIAVQATWLPAATP
jgi:hypothetical protein